MCLEVWSGFLVDSIYMGPVCVSIQPVCVFWLEHLIHLHLIINTYVPIAIFLIVWGWYCRSFIFFCISPLISPFNICYKAGLGYWIPLTFACLKSFWFLPQFWMRSVPGTVILVVEFYLSVLSIYPAFSLWPVRFLLKDQLLCVWGFPCMLLISSPLLLLIFFLCV